MVVLAFFLGLLVGLLLLKAYRSQLRLQFKALSQELALGELIEPFSPLTRISQEVTAQRQHCQQLEQQLEALKQLLQVSPIAYVQVDEDNQLIWCNQQGRQLLNLQQWDDRRPRLLLEIVRSYELDQLIEKTRQQQQPTQSEWVLYPISADTANLSRQQAYPLRGFGIPLPQHQVGVFLENRQEAVALTQQRDRWTSDVAHELKTPLTSLRLVAETLQTRLEGPLRTWVDRLLGEVIRLSNLVQDLLDLSQIEMGSVQGLKRTPVNLTELIQAAWLSLEPLARKKHVYLEYVGEDCLPVQVDEPRLYRVLINLLDNSIKYSPPRQHIRVQVTLQDLNPQFQGFTKQFRLEVIDAGPGFIEGDLPRVFERFYRADQSRARPSPSLLASDLAEVTKPSTRPEGVEPGARSDSHLDTRLQGGTGLGLSIVRQIVEAHQGRVTASNHPETGGAWIQVWIPYSPAQPESLSA